MFSRFSLIKIFFILNAHLSWIVNIGEIINHSDGCVVYIDGGKGVVDRPRKADVTSIPEFCKKLFIATFYDLKWSLPKIALE